MVRPKGSNFMSETSTKKGKTTGTETEETTVTIKLGKRNHSRLAEMAKPFGMTIEEAAEFILKKALEKN